MLPRVILIADENSKSISAPRGRLLRIGRRNNPAFRAEAKALGEAIAAAGMGLVYGGANVGLMGAVADAALAGGAEVIGVLPDCACRQRDRSHGPDHARTGSHHARAQGPHGRAGRRFPGVARRYGTLDELMEAVTWAQLGLHSKLCILINTCRVLGRTAQVSRFRRGSRISARGEQALLLVARARRTR